MPTTIHQSLRRSHVRVRVLLQLALWKEAYPAALAQACGVDARRLRYAMYGDGDDYRPDLALVTLGLAREVRRAEGPAYEITDAGAHVAAGLRAHYRSFYAP